MKLFNLHTGAIAGIGFALALAACAPQQSLSGGLQTAGMTAEKAETGAELAYVGLATYLNADETAHPGNVAKDEATKLKAWRSLQDVRTLYAAGKDFTAAAASLQSVVTAAGGGAAATASAAAPK